MSATETTVDATSVAGRRKRMRRALVARVSDEVFALPLSAVTEAVDAPEVTPVPLAPDGVLGQCVHRGALLPVLDPRVLLGTARSGGPGTLLVMPGAAPAGAPYGIWVDDLSDMVSVEAIARRPLPHGADRTGMLTGLLVVDDLLAGVVNLDALNAAAHALLTSETASR